MPRCVSLFFKSQFEVKDKSLPIHSCNGSGSYDVDFSALAFAHNKLNNARSCPECLDTAQY